MDYALPVSVLLKEGTKEVHDAAHRSRGASHLINGKLTQDEYVLYLLMLHQVYRYSYDIAFAENAI